MRQDCNGGLPGYIIDKVSFLTGSAEAVGQMINAPAKKPFDHKVLSFLDTVSKNLMQSRQAKAYPDVVTLGFWLRQASLKQLAGRYGYGGRDGEIRFGRGIAFHICPSNVPVNFAYSLFSGLLAGNGNIVRVPSKDFPQVALIADAIEKALQSHENMRPYLALVRYGRDKEVNDLFSDLADIRIIWGGDATIADIRKSALPPRSTEVTFADRFSFAVIDSDEYLRRAAMGQAKQAALDFYNDTYLTDQNACTSPGLVVWVGERKEAAKQRFWEELHLAVEERYRLQPVSAVNKLVNACLASVRIARNGVSVIKGADNLITRVQLCQLDAAVIDLRERCGFFFEYDADNLTELAGLCKDKRVQTVGVLGDKRMMVPLLEAGGKGIDRVVDIGHMMDFDLVWDGEDLMGRMTRVVRV